MKEKDAKVDYNDHQMTLFVEKEDGTYSSTQTGSYFAKNFLENLSENTANYRKTAIKKLLNNEISPVGFFIIALNMTPADVGARVGVRSGKVEKHMKPNYFKNIRLKLLKKYADVFGIDIANFFQYSADSIIVNPESLEMEKTENPFVVILNQGKKSWE